MAQENNHIMQSFTDVLTVSENPGHEYRGISPITVDNLNDTISIDSSAVSTQVTGSDYIEVTETTNESGNKVYELDLSTPLIEGFVTPEQFGAVGDGVTDDTAAIQAALLDSNVHKTKVLLTNKYKVTQPVKVYAHSSIEGISKKKATIDFYNNACFYIGTAGGTQQNEIRMSTFNIMCHDECDYAIRCDAAISQCTFHDLYIDHTRIACVFMKGSINWFTRSYFYYSPCGVILDNCAFNSFEQCNFWSNDIAFKGQTSDLSLISTWIERCTNVFVPTATFYAYCTNSHFLDGRANVGYITDVENNTPANIYLNFENCRINYPNNTQPLFRCRPNANGYSRVNMIDGYVACQSSALIDNDGTNSRSCQCSYKINGARGLKIFTTPSLGVQVDSDYNNQGATRFGSGIVLGGSTYAIPSTENPGLVVYDKDIGSKLKVVDDKRTWHRIAYENYVTPEQFGAVGDGTTDDTAAIQAALDNANAGSNVVLLTAYAYRVESDLFVKSNTQVIGRHFRYNHIHLYNGAQVKIGSSTGSNSEHITLANFTIDGDNTSYACVANSNSANLHRHVTFDNINFINSTNTGLDLNGTYITIKNCLFSNHLVACTLPGAVYEIKNCIFDNNVISVMSSATRIYFSNNSVSNSAHSEIFAISGSTKIIADECYFYGSSDNKDNYISNYNETNYTYTLEFNNCYFDFSKMETPIIVVYTNTNVQRFVTIKMNDCSFVIPNINSIIDNTNADYDNFRFVNEENDIDNSKFLLYTNKATLLGCERAYMKYNYSPAGIILGNNRSEIDLYANTRSGRLVYDDSTGFLKVTTGGTNKTIPVKANTAVNKLASGAQLSDVIDKMNDLLTALSTESNIINSN